MQAPPVKTAHYFTGMVDGKRVHYVVISDSYRPIGRQFTVSGKREARELAAAHWAKPWNF